MCVYCKEEVRTQEEEDVWNRKADSDGVAMDRGKKILYLVEFKRLGRLLHLPFGRLHE